MKAFLIKITLTVQLVFCVAFFAYSKILHYKKDSATVNTLTIAGDTYYIKWLLKENFDSKEREKDWILETTKADVEIKNGKLFITDYGIGTTLWYKTEFPENIIIRYTTQSEKGMSDNKLNFNTISHARENDGSILKIGPEAKRTGAYAEYHQFKNYISTLTFKHSRLRKNPDFKLLSDSDIFASENQTYQVVYTVQNGRVRYYLDNVKVHDFQDTEPLDGGKFGLRTWNTKASWDKIEIGLLIKK